FCETLMRESVDVFSREQFNSRIHNFCRERLIDLEVHVVFDVLYQGRILAQIGDRYCFRFNYWIFYFAAQRMHDSQDFANWIYSNMRYAQYPEVLEFYTGIDRRRSDALKMLTSDLREIRSKVESKCGLPDKFNPFRYMEWRPSPKDLERMNKEVQDGVSGSKLPTAVKDEFADRTYDPTRPYVQELREILSEHSVVYLMRTLSAAARALRNSDYVDPNEKRELIDEIFISFRQLAQVLMVILPPLVDDGKACIEGAHFHLVGEFGEQPDERLRRILVEMPRNIIAWYSKDIFSQKMGPMLIEKYKGEGDEIMKHFLILLIVAQRPRNWRRCIENYISSNAKNSYYLYDTYRNMRTEYRYSFSASSELKDLEYCIKMASAKHHFGSKSPGPKAIKKIGDSVLPKREPLVEDDD
ncbi:MAG: hypothetical protein AAGA58_17645, partial [Verrucomicrobiota bacterium]